MKRINFGGQLTRAIFAVVEIVVGVLLFIDAKKFTAGVIITCGILLLALGAFSIFRYFRTPPEIAAVQTGLVQGLIMIILGLFGVIKPDWFSETFILNVLYGIIVLLLGLLCVQRTSDALRLKFERWYLPAVNAVVLVVLSILILVNPFEDKILYNIIGIALIFAAAMDLLTMIFMTKTKEKENENKDMLIVREEKNAGDN